METKAGSRYEIAIKSGGPFANMFGGGMVGPAGYRSRFSGYSPISGRRSIGNAQTNARNESLRRGEIQVKDTVTGSVVWWYMPDRLPGGISEGHFLEEIELDLENLSVSDFNARWGIKT